MKTPSLLILTALLLSPTQGAPAQPHSGDGYPTTLTTGCAAPGIGFGESRSTHAVETGNFSR